MIPPIIAPQVGKKVEINNTQTVIIVHDICYKVGKSAMQEANLMFQTTQKPEVHNSNPISNLQDQYTGILKYVKKKDGT
jgi:hypothetical protein